MVRFLRQVFWLLLTVVQSLANYGVRRHSSASDRAKWMHVWSAKCLNRLGVECSFVGEPPTSGLVVSNHLGYLDIMVFGSAMRCVFVSKAEVKRWPVFGWLASLAGTVYVDRTRRSDTRNANEGIRRVFAQDLPVVIFPEGTSTGGGEVLPFYPSLFEPAIENGVPITAAYLSYEVEGGTVADDVAYWGTMTFFPHLLRLLRLRKIKAIVRFSGTPRVYADRKKAAQETRGEVLRLSEAAPETVIARW
jgi:1-acyl-sn-glycerol-3-phosphate acyltransferase